MPAISVVVATHGRCHLLGRLVAALEAQAQAPPFEVVVVDDASTDGTWDELGRLQAGVALELRALRLERRSGPATARNLGWREARAPLVAFTDDDCVPQPRWLARLVDGLAGADLVQGATLPLPDREPGRGPFSRSLWVEEEDGRYATANMGYRRSVLERLGGFDERFRHPQGEDIDLAWRARESGATTAFCPEALVHHEVFPSNWWAYVKETRRREGVAQALARHPLFRAHLRHGWLYREGHGEALLAAAGLSAAASAVVRPGRHLRGGTALGLVAALFLAPYAHLRLVRHPLPCRRRHRLPVAALTLVADLAEVAVLGWSSWRHRTFVL